jgi:hypothetical protein
MEKAAMNDLEDFGFRGPNELGRRAGVPGEPQPRAVGSPLPVGSGSPSPIIGGQGDAQNLGATPPPPGRALAGPNPAPSVSLGDLAPTLQWAANALRSLGPFVQKILPLLDGNVATAVSNVMAQQSHPPSPPVSLEPLEDSLAELQTQHRDLRNQIVDQNTSLKRVEDQLEMVREATDRNTLEQQELLEDLKSVGTKVTTFAFFALALLVVSILVNVILYLHIRRIFP